jgi:hypothetical protein
VTETVDPEVLLDRTALARSSSALSSEVVVPEIVVVEGVQNGVIWPVKVRSVKPPPLVARTVNEYEPPEVAVPDTRPVEVLRARPVGTAPATTA